MKRGGYDDQVERPADGSLYTSVILKVFQHAGSDHFHLQAADQLTLDGHVCESLPPARAVAEDLPTAARRVLRFMHLPASSDREEGGGGSSSNCSTLPWLPCHPAYDSPPSEVVPARCVNKCTT